MQNLELAIALWIMSSILMTEHYYNNRKITLIALDYLKFVQIIENYTLIWINDLFTFTGAFLTFPSTE